jgi:hypothetical protein
MIKASELRIGNIAQDEGGGIREIVSITSNEVESVCFGIPASEIGLWDDRDHFPIHLDKNVLLSAGFKTLPNNLFYHSVQAHFGLGGPNEDGSFSIVLRKDGFPKGKATYFPFGYVSELHKLQNLFFCFFGQELSFDGTLQK